MTTSVPPRTVSHAKIAHYLLNAAHEVGGPKAAFFRAFGFSLSESAIVAAALTHHPDRNPVRDVVTSRWGTKYVVTCTVETPDGRNPCITSIWIVRSGRTDAEFVTAYPANP